MWTLGTTAASLKYGDFHISEAFCTLLVGMVMQTHSVECYEAMFESSPCCTLATKANHRLVLVPVLT